MTEPGPSAMRFLASDGYPLHVAHWTADGPQPVRGQVVVLHGVQSHSGWYHSLGKTLAGSGYHAWFPDRRGSGANAQDRGHAPSAGRLVKDIVELIKSRRDQYPGLPMTLAGISWGGKLVVVTAARHPALVDGVALVCPGLLPRVRVTFKEKLQIAWAFFSRSRRRFPIPLSDPALFTDSPPGRRFIAADPLSLREATADLLAASFIIDRMVSRAPSRLFQPALLMLAGKDRIVDNARTSAYFQKLAAPDRVTIEYPDGCHTLEFEPDPILYALDLARWMDHHVSKAVSKEAGVGCP